MKKANFVRVVFIASALAVIPTLALAQTTNAGKKEYEANCAVCHGTTAKGDGPLAGYITQKVTDLTVLAKNNKGVFPFNDVYEVIDGRRAVKGHGTRDMPAWGHEYNVKSHTYFCDYRRPYDPESFVRGKILALTAYIYDLQVK